MAFPTLSAVIEDWTSLSEWTAAPFNDGSALLTISGGNLTGGLNNSGWKNDATFGPDIELQLPVLSWDTSGNGRGIKLYARVQQPSNTVSTGDGYALVVYVNGTDTTFEIHRIDNTVATGLASGTLTGALAVNDRIGFEIIGNALKGYHKPAAGSWTQKVSTTDATYGAAGYFAARTDQTNSFDDLIGGTVGGIQFDAASSSGYEPALSSYSWSHTCTGTNRGLIVGISIFAAGTVTAVTYAGTPLTFIRAVTNGLYRAELWGMPAPASGTNTIAVTLSTSLTSIGSAISYTTDNQTTPFIDSVAATGTGNPASVIVTPATDNTWIVDLIATSDGSITVGAGQTSRANNSGALGSGAMSDKGPITPASAQTMQWTGIGALDTWAYLGVAVDPFVDLPVYTPALGIVEIRGEAIADWAETPAGDLMLMGVGS